MKGRFKSVQKLDMQLEQEAKKQTGIIYSAACMALFKEWGWKKKRLESLFEYINAGIEECAGHLTKKSILNMLEEETGIELNLAENGKSFHDIDYLNGNLGMYQIEKLNYAQIMTMRIGQIKWLPAITQATLFLALHRKSGFGAERIQRLLNQIFEIERDFNSDMKTMVNACTELTGIDVLQKARGK